MKPKKHVVYAYLRGGLGNQMFCYATARALEKRYFKGEGKTILATKKYGMPNLLNHFRLADNVEIVEDFHIPTLMYATKKICGSRFCRTPRQMYQWEERCKRLTQKAGVIRRENGYIDLPKQLKGPILFEGFGQSELYFKNAAEEIKKEFAVLPDTIFSLENIDLMQQVENEKSVALCVRLGDYEGNAAYQVCKQEYYQDAVDYVKKQIPGCRFFVFSDNIEKVKKNLELPENTKFESGTSPDYETLTVISKCKHFIISNSTYHWWGQYLSQSRYKVVVAPKRWYGIDIPCDIYQTDWMLL